MLEQFFKEFRNEVIGIDQEFDFIYGRKKIIYCDWTASGRLYRPIETRLSQMIGAYMANTHTETNVTGNSMTTAYQHAKNIIKSHVNARKSDILISSNTGMTGVVNKFQRILGLRIHEKFKDKLKISQEERPVVFITHMEHHSNQTSWLETIADVVIIPTNDERQICLNKFEQLLQDYNDRKVKYAAITSCSNVTGILTPYYKIAEIMHRHNGYCFVDFAASAPYIDINMHPGEQNCDLDAIYFSPHKFLGGPGSSGIVIFNPALYNNRIPDDPGGGTVDWTNPWGEHKYHDEIEAREDGGTPGFLQTMKVALAIRLKEQMGTTRILDREHEIMEKIWKVFDQIPNLHVLDHKCRERLGIISFYVEDLHHNLTVKMLNDRFGVQVRGGCLCAGTYGHFLLNVDRDLSKKIVSLINQGNLSLKPGWVRMSIHPVMSDEEIDVALHAVREICQNHKEWSKEYSMDTHTGEFYHLNEPETIKNMVHEWFEL
ncbi:MAG TPA: selenocysteine lyase [Saprospirales bacterium]|nr:selenocysteine lyase [Saprospirales bacterium]HAY70633.1 selenocysteine lyase [Saprospirales bacterium]HRQ29869.1 aminotransferase class V-fold PLP-dependent enzyme [Saprospiraceae bacterium]